MLPLFRKFREDDTGAVTVDWVVLTAAVVGLATGIYISVEDNTNLLAADAALNIAGEIGQ